MQSSIIGFNCILQLYYCHFFCDSNFTICKASIKIPQLFLRVLLLPANLVIKPRPISFERVLCFETTNTHP